MRARQVGRLVTVAAVITVLLTSCDWPMPGHDANRSSNNPDETTLTPATVGGLTEAFSVTLPVAPRPPVIAAGRLLATAGRTVHSYDRRTGAPQWTYTLPDSPWPSGGEPSASGPYVDGSRVAVDDVLGFLYDATAVLDLTSGTQLGDLMEDGAVAALRGHDAVLVNRVWTGSSDVRPVQVTVRPTDAAAAVRWAGYVDVHLGGPPAHFEPTLGDGTLYGDLDGDVVAYDLDVPCPSGVYPVCLPLWRASVQAVGPVVLSPDGATLFTGTTDGRFVALDATTGATRWSAEGLGSVNGLPALADGRLYVPTTEHVLAFDAGGCGQSTCEPLWTTARGSGPWQPVVGGDVLYVGAPNGIVDAYDLTTCDQMDSVPVWTGHVDGEVSGGLAVASGRLYVGTTTGVTAFALPG